MTRQIIQVTVKDDTLYSLSDDGAIRSAKIQLLMVCYNGYIIYFQAPKIFTSGSTLFLLQEISRKLLQKQDISDTELATLKKLVTTKDAMNRDILMLMYGFGCDQSVANLGIIWRVLSLIFSTRFDKSRRYESQRKQCKWRKFTLFFFITSTI